MAVIVTGPEVSKLAQSNAQVVERFLDALTRRDASAIASLLSDDVTYRFPGSNALSGTYLGRDQVLAFLPRLSSLLDGPPAFEVGDVLSSAGHAADFATYRGARFGRAFSWRTIRLYRVVGQEISEIVLTIEDQAAFDAFLPEP